MSDQKEIIKVRDSKGFIYEVSVTHSPHWGFSTAYYYGSVIGQVVLNKIKEPLGDNDAEWEMYQESFAQWRDEILLNMDLVCKQHFDSI